MAWPIAAQKALRWRRGPASPVLGGPRADDHPLALLGVVV